MDTTKLKNQLIALKGTINFETVAIQVFNRLLYGSGLGLVVLYGPPKKSNKTYFLQVVEALQYGCPDIVREFVSAELWALLSRLDKSTYRCVNIIDIIKKFNLEPNLNYKIPLGATTSLAIALTANSNGFEKGSNIVILCDDLHKYARHNSDANERFLSRMAPITSNLRQITFLAATSSEDDHTHESTRFKIGSEHFLNLGCDQRAGKTQV